MKRDDIKSILGENATEEQITNLLNAFHNSNTESKKEIDDLKNKLNNFSDYDALKSKLNQYEQEKMTEEQKIEQMRKDTAENLKKAKIIYNSAKVKEILAGENIDEKLINTLVSDDENLSIANANYLKQTLSSLKDSVAKQTKESLVNANVNPTISNVNQNEKDAMTIEKFNELSAEEQDNFVNTHPEEFNKLF